MRNYGREDIPLVKRQIEVQLREYEEAIAAYRAWVDAWYARQAPARPADAEKSA